MSSDDPDFCGRRSNSSRILVVGFKKINSSVNITKVEPLLWGY